MMKRTLKGLLAGFLILVVGLVPTGQARAADLAFPILFAPIYSQNEAVAGAFTDTRFIVFNPSKHCPIAVDPDCTAGFFAALGPGTHLRIFFFDKDEKFLREASFNLTPFDVEVVTGPFIPDGTGTAILVNTFTGVGVAIVAFFHPLAAVVEIGAKLAAGNIQDGQAAGEAGTTLFAVTASEAQLIPAISGEFPRVEISAGAGGAAIPFGPNFETVIVETCLFPGIIDNFIVRDDEKFLGDTLIVCTGFGSTAVSGPDLLVWTPDDGGLLGTGAAPVGGLSAGYNRLAIDVDSFSAITLFYGQAIVIMPGGANRQAYSYNMPANWFFPFTAAQAPTNETDLPVDEVFGGAAEGATEAIEAVCGFPAFHVACSSTGF